MELNENTVEQNSNVEADDALPESVVEEQQVEPEESLDSLIGDDGQKPAEESQKEEPQGTGSEPGWFRKRWDKEVGKLTAQIRNEIRSEYEAQLAPMKERMMEMDAQELVRTGKVKDLETAKELVRYRQGQPAPAAQTKTEQPRQPNGQFASANDEDPATSARIDMLRHQANRIKANGGPDVIAEFQNNEDIKQQVISGEMDFYDVAEHMKQAKKRRPPAPTRSPNGASGSNPNAIDTMSDEQFDRMERKIKEGARYSLK